ncbi:transmembrane protease serine 9 [Anopheles gambiae]|uniref:transmembrane protease serine 9-like n=1 Tax=Anopheles coluzzii TaxID=1518534 RepID=UPI0020FFE3EA|nr:transmembrane protease serine 9-like [Anopheles coluzzii]XP_061518491.1 transmembrane protease serine 9 [Anopheles gambiae]
MPSVRVIFAVAVCLSATVVASVDESEPNAPDDTVVIEAAQPPPRQPRQVWLNAHVPHADWKQTLGDGSPCLTAKGHLGFCTSFRKCYPYFKVPDLSVWESWVLGNYDTCSYFNEQGRQAFGVCCTNPITPLPIDSNPVIEAAPGVMLPPPASTGLGSEPNKPPNKNNNYPSWPPPIPTHPPDHTPATHPPAFGGPPAPTTVSSVVDPAASEPTQRPTTTWPTRPRPPQVPNQPTPAPPAQPIGVWPPPVPTHPPLEISTLPPSSSGVVVSDPSNLGCGVKNGNPDTERIVGGHNADPNEWPWIAGLFNNGRQFCGGSLIDSIHILTAAHCVAHMSSYDVARLSVKLGDHNIRSNTEVQHVERRVKRLVRHRGFDSRTLYNDVAVLTMDQAVPFTKQVRPICLPAADSTRAYSGLTATVIGWGSLRENGPQPAILQEVNLPIWTNNECRIKYGPAAPGGIIDTMLCAGQAAKDSCSGDSGGPLMVNDGKWTQVGVVSWGIGCGKGQYPGVYTRVTAFLPWIKKNINDA